MAWQKTYGDGGIEIVYSIQQTSDGGYIALGSTSWPPYLWVLKLNSTGDIDWQKSYGVTVYNWGANIQQTTDGGYIVAGYVGPDYGYCGNIACGDWWISKLDGSGNVMWQKSYGGGYTDLLGTILQTSDGGCIVAGAKFFDSVNSDLWIVKLNSDGTVVWQKTYGGVSSDMSSSIQQTSDGGYVVAGQTYSFGAGDSDIWVLKLDANGDIGGSCGIVGTSNVTVTDTNVTPVDTSATVTDTSATVTDTSVTPQDSNATVTTQCEGQ